MLSLPVRSSVPLLVIVPPVLVTRSSVSVSVEPDATVSVPALVKLLVPLPIISRPGLVLNQHVAVGCHFRDRHSSSRYC